MCHFMSMRMGPKIILVLALICIGSSATHVELSNSWREDLGFVTECSWQLFSNDSLQSVRLSNNDQQFMIYRPERDGRQRARIFPVNENFLEVDCMEHDDRGLLGKCVLTLELRQAPVADFTYTCEVSGERPMFLIEKKDIVVSAYVPPTEAVIKEVKANNLVTLNCTSTGIPAPTLSWTVGDQKVPHDFSGGVWNATSKLWHVWSLFSYSTTQLKATCTPEVSRDGQIVTAPAAVYSGASRIGIHGIAITLLYVAFKITMNIKNSLQPALHTGRFAENC